MEKNKNHAFDEILERLKSNRNYLEDLKKKYFGLAIFDVPIKDNNETIEKAETGNVTKEQLIQQLRDNAAALEYLANKLYEAETLNKMAEGNIEITNRHTQA